MTKVHALRADNWALGRDETPKRPRRPSLKRQIAAAEKAGKHVTSVTTTDGITLRFDEPTPTAGDNPWLAAIEGRRQ